MVDPIDGVSSPDAAKLEQQKLHAQQKLKNIELTQETIKDDFQEWVDMFAFNPLAMKKQFETLEKKTHQRVEAASAEAEKSKEEGGDNRAQQIAEKYAGKNPEFSAQGLLILLSRMSEADSFEEMLAKARDAYPDHTMTDEALDFLIEAAGTDTDIGKKAIKAKEQFNDEYGREIRAGKNIAEHARAFSELGLGSPTALRDLYRDIVGNPRDPQDLFDELTGAFSFDQMKEVIDFILHSLGTDLKAKGPSIPRAELERLFTESRVMQAFLGLYRFFQKRMHLIEGLFDADDLNMPAMLSFELLAKQLMKLLKERYPTSTKIRQLAYALGVGNALDGQVILFSQYRDAMRHISPRLFKSERHRQDFLLSILEALGEIEDEMDEDEEEEEGA